MIIEIAHEDIERASAMMADLCAPMTDMVLQDAVAYFAAHRQAAYAAGVAAERERIISELRDDARQTEVDARRILGNLIKLRPVDIDGWAKMVAMKHGIANMLERPSAAIAAATEGGAG